MEIPKYHELQYPILEILQDDREWKPADLELILASKFQLSKVQIDLPYDSGNGSIFKDRIRWALSYLNIAGLVSKPKRGVYQINSYGLDILRNPKNFRQEFNKLIKSKHVNPTKEEL
jgi:restriction system protein